MTPKIFVGKPTYDICVLSILGGYVPDDVVDYQSVLNWFLLLFPCIWCSGDFSDMLSIPLTQVVSIKSNSGCFFWGVSGWSLQQTVIEKLTFSDSLLLALALVSVTYIAIHLATLLLSAFMSKGGAAELLGGGIFIVLLYSPHAISAIPLPGNLMKASMLFQIHPFAPVEYSFVESLSILLAAIAVLLVLCIGVYYGKNSAIRRQKLMLE